MEQKRSFLNALKWAYTANVGQKVFAALFTFILAGILGPREFGMVAIAVVFIGFLQLFLDQGLIAALIQRSEIEQEHLDAVFWMDLALGILFVLLSLVCSRKWAAINHSPEIVRIIPALSVCILIESLAVVPTALLRRDLDFKSLSLRTNLSVLGGGIVGVTMALTGFGIWSLVWQQIVRDSIALVSLWTLTPWRPRFEFSWIHLKSLLGFSIPTFVGQLGAFASFQADLVVLGLFFGPVAVGLYRIAERVVNCVVTMAMASIQAVSLPEFSRLQAEPDELRKSVLTCIRMTATVTVPALAGLGAVGAVLLAVLGPNWTPALNVLKILSLVGVIMVLTSFTTPLLQALSRPRYVATLEWLRAVLGTLLLLAAGFLLRGSSANGQIAGIAGARFVMAALFVAPVYMILLMRFSGISLRDIVAALMPSTLASVAVIGSVMLFRSTGWLTSERAVIQLISQSVIGGSVGLAVLLSLEAQLRRMVAGIFHRCFHQPAVPDELA